MKKYLFIVIVSFCCSVAATAQSFQIYDVATAALPSDRIQAIAHDDLGNTWVGTDWGLCAFDGITWTIYQSSNSPLPENDIRALEIDANGRIWIGTFQSGVVMLDGSTWTEFNISNSGLPENQIKCIAADSLDVWIGTIGGLAHFDGVSWKVYDSTINTYNDLQLPSSNIAAVSIRADGLVSVGTVNGGFTYLTDSLVTVYSTSATNLPDNTALGVVLDSNGDRWAACPSGALLNHVGSHSNNLWFQYSTINSLIPADALNAVSIDVNDNIYVATQINGIGIFEPPFTWLTYNMANSDLPDDVVLEIKVDPSGKVWCGTETGGIGVLDRSTAVSELKTGQLQIYPNPANDIIRVVSDENLDQVKFQVFDVSGKRQVSDRLLNNGSLDVSGLCSGAYVIKGRFGNYLFQEIFVVSHN